MQDYTGYPTYMVTQDPNSSYYTDPRLHGNQTTWREIPNGQAEGTEMVYNGTQYVAAPAWDTKSGYGAELGEEEYYHQNEIEAEPRKRKRRRVISVEQRRAANIRERKRMFQLNEAFCVLRKRVPTFAYEKKLSRIETLKLAVTYIKFMTDLLESDGGKVIKATDNDIDVPGIQIPHPDTIKDDDDDADEDIEEDDAILL
ncbi:hypothetical protein CAPTEDRAFT_220993 [Capitella teleta]|uniref:BHLH domain-containing protein n=1 Tax=Capitella teleta TaxID=283909 RepID=R7THQ9_CAPTE|nr:hypothetical protein CAPTEDRAFT_220993 [Capitella teleta]|eukprot:ELT90640.1 hypothetical protein CAPTEDRAFT_220993 [Capitella teleta]